MDSLIKSLPAILAASGHSDEVAEAACIAAWKYAFGVALSDRARPVQLRNKTLDVLVDDAVWKRQLDQMRDHFLFRLNSALGQPLVKSIEFRVDAEGFRKLGESNNDLHNEKQPANNAAIPIELLSAAAGIEDPGLRRAFLGAAVSCVNRVEQNPKTEI
jgi:hypothetical protein